jgi:hypothetical protein
MTFVLLPDLEMLRSTKRSIRFAAAFAVAVILFDSSWPAKAMTNRNRFSDLAANMTAKRTTASALTAHLPWLAPVGHRQPRKIDVPQNQDWSAWALEERRLDKELDRKLIICRGC